MSVWPREVKVSVDVIDRYRRQARVLRNAEFRRTFLALGRLLRRSIDYTVAPFAFGLRKCSSSRGRISTKLHGR